jgi:creatinine amidohydrolase
MPHKLERMLWQQVRDMVPDMVDTVVLPIGTIEAHGAACLGTDVFIPVDISEYVCDKFNFILAPPIWYGITRSLLDYAGSLTIEPDNLQFYVMDILRSLHRHKFDKVIIMNGHGGNNSVLKDCASIAFRELNLKVAVIHWWILCAEVTKEVYGMEGGHAGIDETGYVVSLDPKLADKSHYQKSLVYEYSPGTDVYPVPGTVLLYNEKGEGEPDFDPEKGRVYAEKVKEKVAESVKYILDHWKTNLPTGRGK